MQTFSSIILLHVHVCIVKQKWLMITCPCGTEGFSDLDGIGGRGWSFGRVGFNDLDGIGGGGWSVGRFGFSDLDGIGGGDSSGGRVGFNDRDGIGGGGGWLDVVINLFWWTVEEQNDKYIILHVKTVNIL